LNRIVNENRGKKSIEQEEHMKEKSTILKRAGAILCLAVFSAFGHAQQVPGTLREGRHMFTMQWIFFETSSYGSVMIERTSEPGVYIVKGDQRTPDERGFVTIDGTLRPSSSRELVFTGDIKTMYSGSNGGQVCDRNGTYHFKASGARKYWRLQEMLNCDKSSVDYVDIYFE
jgi:hypothetical protein